MPTAWRREPVPSSVVTRLSLVILRHLLETATLGTYKETAEPTQPEQKGIHFLREECSNSANFMLLSVWQTVLRNFHTPLVRSPADRTKVVTTAALRKFARLETFKSFILSRLSIGFSAFRSWKSPTASSSTEHKPLPAGSVWLWMFHLPAHLVFSWQMGHVFLSVWLGTVHGLKNQRG